MYSSRSKGVYTPRSFIPHAASLHQAFAHCARFPTAASRRSLDRVSVPVWLAILSDQLTIKALVGHYPTNYLIVRGLLLRGLTPFSPKSELFGILCGISSPFGEVFPIRGQITHMLRTRSPCATCIATGALSTCMC